MKNRKVRKDNEGAEMKKEDYLKMLFYVKEIASGQTLKDYIKKQKARKNNDL